MLSKGKKLFPKTSDLGVHIIYTLHIYIYITIYTYNIYFMYIYTDIGVHII